MAEQARQPAVLRVSLLGPVRAWRGDTELVLGSARRRAVFAVLAVQANQAVSRSRLVSGVWGDEPPATVEGSLYTYVSGLRRVLDPARSRWSTGDVLVSAGDGYSLRIAPDDLDVHRFDRLRLAAQRHAARGEHAAALAGFADALALWRGDALTGVTGPFADAQRDRLSELRLVTVEQQARAALAAGQPADVITELAPVAAAHPRRETMQGVLMLALHRTGRSAEALEVYRQTRATLTDELGIEPGAALQQVREQVRSGDPGGPEPRPVRPVQQVASARQPVLPDLLAGRSAEESVLRAAVRALGSGRGGTLWVEGEPGIGKTSLLAAGLTGPDAERCQVLWGGGDELNRRFPMRMVLECLGVDAQSPDPRRAQLAAALRDERALHGDDVPHAVPSVVERLLTLVEQLCVDGPLVLVLDDLQWADPSSLLLLRRLARASGQLPLLLVCLARPAAVRDELGQVRASVLAGGAQLLRLDPLDEDAVADLASARLRAEPGATLLGLTEGAAGNPMFLHDVLTVLQRQGLVEIDDGIADVSEAAVAHLPGTLATGVSNRLGFLSGGTRELLRWAALLGTQFDLGDLSAVAGRPVSELVGSLEEAVTAGVVREAGDRFAFRHALVRQALYEAMPNAVRLSLHRQAAQLLDRAGATADRVADQLLAAPIAIDGWVVDWLLTNTNTIAGSDPAVATRLLERAVSGTGVPQDAREVLTARLARLQFWLGRRPEPEARAVLEMTADASRAAEMRLILAYLDYSRGNVDGALAALREAVADAGIPERWRARHQSLQAMIERCGLDDIPLAQATANDALAKARAAADAWAVAHALQDLWQIESVLRHHESALSYVDRALDAVRGRPDLGDLQLSLYDNKVFTLQNLDRLAEATDTLAVAQDLVSRRGLDGGLHIAAAVHYYWLGRFDDAMTELDSVVRDGPEITFYGLRQRGAILLLHGAYALIAGLCGNTAQLTAHLTDADEYPLATVTDKEHCDFLLAAAAVAAEQRGRPDEALRVFTPTLDREYAQMMLRHQWLPTVVRLAVETGETAIAHRALRVCQDERDLELVPARAANAADWCRGLLDGDGDLVLTVAGRLREVGRPVEHAFALEDAAVLFAAAGAHARAREVYAECHLSYTDLGAGWCLERARQRLQRHGVEPAPAPRAAQSALSAVQVRIAELIADGWPTTDIASQLMLSRNSVDGHVARLLDHLGVDSRLGITHDAISPLKP